VIHQEFVLHRANSAEKVESDGNLLPSGELRLNVQQGIQQFYEDVEAWFQEG